MVNSEEGETGGKFVSPLHPDPAPPVPPLRQGLGGIRYLHGQQRQFPEFPSVPTSSPDFHPGRVTISNSVRSVS